MATQPAIGPPVAATIQPAAPVDLPAVLDLLGAAALPTAGVAEHFGDFLVARAGGQVIGAVGLERYGKSALLRSLVVTPSARGRGLGHALTAEVIEAARRQGVRRLLLLTETASAFFASRGFRRIAREEADPAVRDSVEFSGACCVSAACMQRDL